jgi:hypothetical protein
MSKDSRVCWSAAMDKILDELLPHYRNPLEPDDKPGGYKLDLLLKDSRAAELVQKGVTVGKIINHFPSFMKKKKTQPQQGK